MKLNTKFCKNTIGFKNKRKYFQNSLNCDMRGHKGDSTHFEPCNIPRKFENPFKFA